MKKGIRKFLAMFILYINFVENFNLNRRMRQPNFSAHSLSGIKLPTKINDITKN